MRKSDGNFEADTPDPASPVKAQRSKLDRDGFPDLPLHAGLNRAFAPGRARIRSLGGTMSELASALSGGFDAPVVDATGLTDKYDFTLIYNLDHFALSRTHIRLRRPAVSKIARRRAFSAL